MVNGAPLPDDSHKFLEALQAGSYSNNLRMARHPVDTTIAILLLMPDDGSRASYTVLNKEDVAKLIVSLSSLFES